VYYVNLFYKFFIPGVLGGMAVLVALDFSRLSLNNYRKRRRPERGAKHEPLEAAETIQTTEIQDLSLSRTDGSPLEEKAVPEAPDVEAPATSVTDREARLGTETDASPGPDEDRPQAGEGEKSPQEGVQATTDSEVDGPPTPDEGGPEADDE
jgi:hypothetical protein